MKHQPPTPESHRISTIPTRSLAIEASIPPADGRKITSLLQRHCVVREDDTAESAATGLASMVLTLANIASGYLRVLADGIDHNLATDFVVEGGMAGAVFTNSVIGQVEWMQKRSERNTLFDVELSGGRNKESAKHSVKSLQEENEALVLPAALAKRMYVVGHNNYRQALLDAESKARSHGRGGLFSPEDAEPACRVHLPNRQIGELLASKRMNTVVREALEYPLFFARVSTPSAIRGQAARAHLGRQMLYAEVDSAGALETLRKEVSELGGRNESGAGKGSPAVRVNLCLSAAAGVLDEMVAGGGYQQKSIPQLLWLVEEAAGCGLPQIREASPVDSRPDFRSACHREITRRIGFEDKDRYALQALDGRMAGWRLFLREQEQHLPGIARAAHNLPVALGYGLRSLHLHEGEIDGSEVMAWAKWLVLRMSNRVAAALAAGRDSRAEGLAMKLAEKLAIEGPMKVRELSRCFSRLKADDCRKALSLLAEQGIAGEENGVWGILGNQAQAFAQQATDQKAS